MEKMNVQNEELLTQNEELVRQNGRLVDEKIEDGREIARLEEEKYELEQRADATVQSNSVLNEAWRICVQFLTETGSLRHFRAWMGRRTVSRALRNSGIWPA